MPTVTLKENAMTRLESSAWPLAGGSACVFALAVVLGGQPWQLAFTAAVLAVLAWSWRSPLVVGAALGGIAWLCVTGFDVRQFGDIRVTGSDDVIRATVLVLAGVLAASAHVVRDAGRRYTRADAVWVDFHETGLERTETSGDVMGLFDHHAARRPGAPGLERPFPVHPTEEPRDG